MPGMTHGAGGQVFAHDSRAQPVNCAHLHSAFGPGCPYCRQAAAAAPDALQASGIHAPPPDPAEPSMAYRAGDRPEQGKVIHPDHESDLGAVA